MKKLLFLYICLLSLAGCKKSDFESNFEQSPEARYQEELIKVNTALTGAGNGWVVNLATQAGGGYAFYMTFDGAKQEVKMYGDLNDNTATRIGTSTYRVKADVGATLIFDTYNYINWLQDPNPAAFGGDRATGFKSDVEFTFDHSTADSLVMIGKKYKQKLSMVKATAAQKAIYEAGGYKAVIDNFKSFFVAKNPYIEISTGGKNIKVAISLNTSNTVLSGKRVTFLNVGDDGVSTSVIGKYSTTLDGINILNEGLVYQGIRFVKFALKDATTIVLYDNTGKEYAIKYSTIPIFPLSQLFGKVYTSLSLVNATTYPGWGADYVTRRATAAREMLVTNKFGLTLAEMYYTFNFVTRTMVLKVNQPQNGTLYVANITYGFTKSDAGVFKFTYQTADTNGADIYPNLAALLAQRLNVDNFTIDYFVNPTTGEVLGQFKSVQNPTFTFSGSLQ
ncbi:DUF4302 domain-containing protein [Pedobacter roseus]|uniref:DUF4302 domain-containing protein n=1 Tax=Pedobacter roseus TaxID=336820 RepID=A0A7G9QHQ7_9SPHI|nr:DUF4302 domain-containing protein [Pedobacter roseus]QNN42882.1 DUF4302 domain-containing protein [Pedobacter roseus]